MMSLFFHDLNYTFTSNSGDINILGMEVILNLERKFCGYFTKQTQQNTFPQFKHTDTRHDQRHHSYFWRGEGGRVVAAFLPCKTHKVEGK